MNHIEKTFGAVLDTLDNALFVLNNSGICIYANKKFSEFIGIDSKLLIGLEFHKKVFHMNCKDENCIFSNLNDLNSELKNIHTTFKNYIENEIDLYFDVKPLINYNENNEYLFSIVNNILIKDNEFTIKNLFSKNEDISMVFDQGIWEWNLIDNSVYFSKNFKKMLGYKEDEFIDLYSNLIDNLHPEDKESVLECFNTYFSGNLKEFKLEYRIKTKSNIYIWIALKAFLVRNEDNLPIRLCGVHINNDLQKKSQNEFDELIEKFNHVLENLVDGICIIENETGKLLHFNKSFSRFFEYDLSQLKDLTINKLHDPYTIEKYFRTNIEFIDQVFSNIPCIKSDGSIFLSDLKISKMSLENKLINFCYYSNIIYDIYDIKKFQLILKYIPGIIYQFVDFEKESRKLSFISDDVENIIGVTKESIVKDYTIIFNQIYHEDREKIIYFFNRSKLSKEDTTLQFRINHPLKGLIWVETKSKQMKLSNGSIFLIGILYEITNIKTNVKELLKAKKNAEELNSSKSLFLKNIGIDLKSQIQGIINFSNTMMKTDLSPTQEEYLKFINNSSLSILELLNDIIDYSIMQSGTLQIINQPIHLMTLCESLMEHLSISAHRKNLELILNYDLDLPGIVYGDPIRIKQILLNLLSNAIKYTSKGEVELIVAINSISKLKNEIDIDFRIRDTGIGISVNDVRDLFHFLNKGDSSIKSKYGGTGLGLTISNHLIKLMNSELKIRSTFGKGSIFIFSLILKYNKTSEFLDTSSFPILNKVLVIVSNKRLKKVLQNYLEKLSIDCLVADNFQQAETILNSKVKISLIMIDSIFSDLDLIDCIDGLKTKYQLQQSQFIILHNSKIDSDFFNQCVELQIEILLKPIKMNDLIQLLENISHTQPNTTKEINIESNEKYLSEKQFKILLTESDNINQLLALNALRKLLPNSMIQIAKNDQETIEILLEFQADILFLDLSNTETDRFYLTEEIRKNKNNIQLPIIGLSTMLDSKYKEKCIYFGMNECITKPFIFKELSEIIERYLII
jgi:PAS domain S-box-containing protein